MQNHSSGLRAIVIGSGFAGQGHTQALRHAGVAVVALCGRQPEIVQSIAEKWDIPVASTHWQETLIDLQPDIVALATPASLRRAVIEAAAAQGCHLYCDKPLATTVVEAKDLYHIAHNAGIKHAFAATRRYDPSVAWLSELVQTGAIGNIQEIIFTLRTSLSPVLPWYWALVLEQGGGLLNNHFAHLLSILERVVSGPVIRVMGHAHFDIPRAPVLPGIHDFRDWGARADTLTPEELAAAEWRDCDADTSYSALLRFATPTGEVPVTLVSGPAAVPPDGESGMRLRGERGTLIACGELSFRVSLIPEGTTAEAELPAPDQLLQELPNLGGGTEDRWAALARDFVADIRGEPHSPYLTFQDGWRYQEVAEAIRTGRGGYELPRECR